MNKTFLRLPVVLLLACAACGSQVDSADDPNDAAPVLGAPVGAGNGGGTGNDATPDGSSANNAADVDFAAGFAIRAAANPNLCLRPLAGVTGDYQAAVLAKCDAADANQAWRTAQGQLVGANDRCLALASSRLSVGATLRTEICASDDADPGSLWTLANGTLCLTSDANKCAQVDGNAAAGASLALATLQRTGDNPAQQWQFVAQAGSGSANAGAGAGANVDTGVVLATQLALNTNTTDTSALGGSKKSYSGAAINFPNNPNKWDTWDNYWARAKAGMPSGNSANQTEWIRQAILLESQITGMDKRFILAVILQESSGDVHVRTTNNGVNNPGLMQSHNGVTFADVGDEGKASIFQMVKDGCEGTQYGDGLIQGVKSKKNYFAGARLYNSGTIDDSNLSNGLGSTNAYASDLANRVMGRM